MRNLLRTYPLHPAILVGSFRDWREVPMLTSKKLEINHNSETNIYSPSMLAPVEIVKASLQVGVFPRISKFHLLEKLHRSYCFGGAFWNSKIPVRRPLQLIHVGAMNSITKTTGICPGKSGGRWVDWWWYLDSGIKLSEEISEFGDCWRISSQVAVCFWVLPFVPQIDIDHFCHGICLEW